MEREGTESERSTPEYREFVRAEYERLSAADRRNHSRRLAFQELRLRLFLSLLDPLPHTAPANRSASSWRDRTSESPHV